MPTWLSKHRAFGVPAFFFAFFLVLFAQFPLRGQLPGNADTQLAIALSNQILEKLQLFVAGHRDAFTVLYPSRDILAYGENCYGLAAMFLFFEALARNEITGYYLFLSSIFALNAIALTKLSEIFVGDLKVAMLGGLAFSVAGFVLGNVDDPNVVFVFFPVMALALLFRGCRDHNARALTAASVLSGVQLWFGFYLFVYQVVLLILFLLVMRKDLAEFLTKRAFASCVAAFAVPVLPLFVLYVLNYEYAQIVSPYEVFKDCSLSWDDFTHRLPNNLIYPENGLYLDWVEIRKNCFPGLLLPVFSLVGLVAWARSNRRGLLGRALTFFALAFVAFFFLSFGANNPLLEKFREVPFVTYLRVPSRFYLVCLIVAAVFFARGVGVFAKRLERRSSKASLAAIVLVAFGFIAENVSFPLIGYEYASLIRPTKEYVNFFAGRKEILLDLPSTIRFLPEQGVNTADRLWFFTREALYMNWQTYHEQIIVGGANGYVSKTRTDVEDLVRRLPATEALQGLKTIGVSALVFHKKLVLFPDEDILEALRASPRLKLLLETEAEAIFAINL